MKKKWLLPLLRRRIVVALLVLAQAALFVYFLVSTGRLSSVLSGAFSAISVIVSLFVLAGKGESSYKLTWVFVILIFPVVGGLLYLSFDQHALRYSLMRRAKGANERVASHLQAAGGVCPDAEGKLPKAVHYLSSFAGYPAYTRAESTFLSSGEEMFSRLKEELLKAKRYIFMEYFIIEHGVMWDEILAILLDKVKAGVEVRIIYDDMGCFLRLPLKYGKILRKFGIHAVKFNPFVPFFSVEQNNRDHRKITVIDGRVAFTGGINLADEYIGSVERFGKWADTAVLIEGDAAWSFALMFLQMWEIAKKNERLDPLRYLPDAPCEEKAPSADGALKVKSNEEHLILPYADSPLDTENVGALVYMDIIQSAKRYVYITTPYLIIDDQMLNALTFAAKSGVDVRIITPHKWDKRLVHMATRSYYHTLWERGVKIYEYTPGFMHAKMVVADDEVATVGSINFDYRSFYLHFECGAYLYKTDSVAAVKHAFLEYMDASSEVSPKPLTCNPITRLFRAIMRLLAPLL